MSAINVDQLLFEEKPLYVPELSEVVNALSIGFKDNFEEVSVCEIECPDLTAAPYHLAANGLSGLQTIIDIGGPPFVFPLVDRTKMYDLVGISRKILPNANSLYICGAGIGPYPLINSCCEGIFNLKIDKDGSLVNETHIARVIPDDESCMKIKVPQTETKCAVMANLYLSEGRSGKVIRVHCKKRIGSDNFIDACRNVVCNAFGDKQIGIGGVFVLKNGKVHQHVMRDFSKTPIHTEEDLNEWLIFYEMPAELVALGTFVTGDFDLDLRLKHFHNFSQINWGGHYHYDTTPNIVEYEAYFNVGERIVRIDRPIHTHQFGRV